jgi:UDP-glucose 4-epimerase
MKYLITGGSGFIGSNLAQQLVNNNENVTIFDTRTSELNNLHEIINKVSIHFGDIRFLDSLQQITEIPDVIFHLAAVSRISASYADPRYAYEVNVTGTLNILEYAKINGCKVIYAGTNAVYDNVYGSPYVYTKWLGEQNCEFYHKIYKVPVAIGRLFNVYGPKEKNTLIDVFSRQKDNLHISGTGEQKKDFTHIYDIINGLISLSKSEYFFCDIFDFGTGKNYSILEIAKLFNLPIIFEPSCPGDTNTTLANIEKSKLLLNYQPKYDIIEYIKSLREV